MKVTQFTSCGKLTGCLVALLALSACNTSPVKPAVAVTESFIVQRDAKLASLKPWRALGSLVIDSKSQGLINASFAWDASDAGFDIRLIGPLGLKTYRVIEDNTGARLYGGETELQGPSAEMLLRNEIGVGIPLHSMQDWVVGLQGSAKEAQRDSAGRLSRMVVTENDKTKWRVNFERYSQVDDLDLPRTILVSGEGLDIKLSVKKWIKPDTVASDRLLIPGVGS